MYSIRFTALSLVSLVSLAGCFATHDTETPLSREEVAAMDGKSDGVDLCDTHSFYGDGEWCDCYCPLVDPDCEDGLPEYVSCDEPPPPACPDPSDPRVHYIEGSHADPSVCLPILFGCEEGQTLFTDECGCGCIDDAAPPPPPPSGCPDPSDEGVLYHSCFTTDAWTCEEDQRMFVDPSGCGCGCEPIACPDPASPTVHYVADSYRDPMACAAILFECAAGQTTFSDDCGCGCVDGT